MIDPKSTYSLGTQKPFGESKPAIASVGMVSNTVGFIAAIDALAAVLGYPVPVGATVAAVVSAVTHILGIWGRQKATKKIEGILGTPEGDTIGRV